MSPFCLERGATWRRSLRWILLRKATDYFPFVERGSGLVGQIGHMENLWTV